MKLITLANLRSGGKSSIARLLAEKLNSTILNFDKKEIAKHIMLSQLLIFQKIKLYKEKKIV